MFIKIPFESEIPFKTNISEITKMSLEHDFNVNDDVVLGNFYISGEYRTHEVSVNTEPFNFTIPFSVDYRSDLKKDTLEFNIEDFAYEIINGNTLKVNIEYSLQGEVSEEELFERVDENVLESELEYIDEFFENDALTDDDEVIEEVIEEKEVEEIEEIEEIKEEVKEEEKIEVEPIKEEVEEKAEEKEIDERISKTEEKTIMDTIKNNDDTFVTYHVHIVKESETIDSICTLYNVNNSLVKEYNEVESISIGDKILIPKVDE